MSNSTDITFLSGLDSIGSNIISIQYGNYRVITDFGIMNQADPEMLLDHAFTEKLIQRNQLPAVGGLYSKSQLPNQLLESLEDSSVKTIVCISHLHLDHIGALYHIPSQIPVYANENAVSFYEKLSKTKALPDYKVNWQPVKNQEVIEFGPLKFQFHLSDHDTIGPAAIFIQTPDFKIIHSGDLRLTGFHPNRVLRWVNHARHFQPDVLLIEGTTFSHSGDEPNPTDQALADLTINKNAESEFALMDTIDELLAEYEESLFAFNGYVQNLERIYFLAQLAQSHGRQLILQPDQYQIYTSMGFDGVLKLGETITLAMIAENPKQYIIQVDEYTYQQLFDLPKGILLHSNGVPLGSFMPSYEPYVRSLVEKNWIFVHANCSGHALQSDLLTIAYTIAAQYTVPWHTFKPQLFAEALEKRGLITWLPELNQVYSTEDILAMNEED